MYDENLKKNVRQQHTAIICQRIVVNILKKQEANCSNLIIHLQL